MYIFDLGHVEHGLVVWRRSRCDAQSPPHCVCVFRVSALLWIPLSREPRQPTRRLKTLPARRTFLSTRTHSRTPAPRNTYIAKNKVATSQKLSIPSSIGKSDPLCQRQIQTVDLIRLYFWCAHLIGEAKSIFEDKAHLFHRSSSEIQRNPAQQQPGPVGRRSRDGLFCI